MCPLRNDRHKGYAHSLRHPNEARARAKHDLIAPSRVAVGLEIAPRVDERGAPRREHSRGILGGSAHRAEPLEDAPQWCELPHGKVVRQHVERCLRAEPFPKRAQGTGEIGTGDPPVVIRHEEGRSGGHVLEPLAPKTEVALVQHRAHRKKSANQARVAAIDAIRIERHPAYYAPRASVLPVRVRAWPVWRSESIEVSNLNA
jgi:hypothetical protein